MENMLNKLRKIKAKRKRCISNIFNIYSILSNEIILRVMQLPYLLQEVCGRDSCINQDARFVRTQDSCINQEVLFIWFTQLSDAY